MELSFFHIFAFVNFQVKILVPNSTAGMIIGKAGSFIKHIKEESGAYVQISQKSLDHALAERCITVIGEFEPNKKAVQMIVTKIVEDPQSGTCLHVSYADVTGPVANFNPTGSPYANASNSSMGASNASNPNYSSNGSLNSMSPTLNNNFNGIQSGGNNNTNMMPFGFQGNNSNTSTQMIENFRGMLRACGYTEEAVNEICNAMATLASYGMLGLGLGINGMISSGHLLGGLGMTAGNSAGCGMPPMGSPGQNATLFPQGPPPGAPSGMHGGHHSLTNSSNGGGANGSGSAGHLSSGNMFGPIGSIGMGMGSGHNSFANHHNSPTSSGGGVGGRPDRLQMNDGSVFEPFRASPSLTSSTPSMSMGNIGNNNSFGIATGLHSPGSLRKSPTPTDHQSPVGGADGMTKFELEVSDNIIGAILGHGGKLLVELQRLSNAIIQISKKGTYAPGTRNRIVTISGQSNAVQTARHLIERQINEEESKRSSQQPPQPSVGNFLH